MKKRILALILVVCFMFTLCVVGASAQVPTVQVAFSAPTLRIDTQASLVFTADEGIQSVSALFGDNGKLVVDRTNMKYNSTYEKYELELFFENGVCEIPVKPKYTGVAVITLSNIVLKSADTEITVDDLQVQAQIKPKATLVYTKQDLANISEDLSKHYVLMNDIEFTEEDFAEGGEFYNDGYGWKPIGTSLNNAFKGSFDGNGFAIEGVKINKADYNYVGLFGVNCGVIENLVVEDIQVDGVYGVYVPVVSSSASSGKIDYESKDVWTPPTGSVNDGDLSGYDRTGLSSAIAGGITGYNVGTVSDCFVEGSVYATPVAAGIAASNVGTIERCYANVSTIAKISGAVTGYNLNHGKIINCHANGAVNGSVMAGGICAENRSSKIIDCYTVACVSGEGNVAAVTNGEYYSTVTNVYYFKRAGITDSVATEYTREDFKNLSFEEDCWEYGFDFPVLSKFENHITNEDFPEDETAEYLQGDIDGDGNVNAADLALLKKIVAALDLEEDASIINPNVDMDGENLVNAADLALLKKIIAGIV